MQYNVANYLQILSFSSSLLKIQQAAICVPLLPSSGHLANTH